MKQLDKRSREYKLLKRYWKLYLKKYKELEGTQQFYDNCLKVPYTQAQIVDRGLNAIRHLGTHMTSCRISCML